VDYPQPWEGVLLALAAFRIWRLIAADTIFDGPRKWIIGLGYRWADGDPIPKKYREHWGIFMECPWCLGFWISVVVWAAWLAVDDWAVGLAVPWALSAVVGLVRENLDPPDEEE
jgi:uncharacterized protein DUF1360